MHWTTAHTFYETLILLTMHMTGFPVHVSAKVTARQVHLAPLNTPCVAGTHVPGVGLGLLLVYWFAMSMVLLNW